MSNGILDISNPLQEVTCTPEGDGPLALITTDIINRPLLNLSQQSMGYPNVQRVIIETADKGLRPNYTFELNYGFSKDSRVEYFKVISEECVNYL